MSLVSSYSPAELPVFYCQEAVHLLPYGGMDDESFLSLSRMLKQALITVIELPPAEQTDFVKRLDGVSAALSDIGCA